MRATAFTTLSFLTIGSISSFAPTPCFTKSTLIKSRLLSTKELSANDGTVTDSADIFAPLKQFFDRDDKPKMSMDDVKKYGVAGTVAYVLTELAFWAVAFPVASTALYQTSGHWPDVFNDPTDRATVLGFIFAGANIARLAVPLRFGVALALAPWVDENIINRSSGGTANDYDAPIQESLELLYRTAETKAEDPDEVFLALSDLEKLMKKKRKAEPSTTPADMLANLDGNWRLVFTTGTAEKQKKSGKVNYFPLNAQQGFDTSTNPMKISNGIYLGDFAVLKFFGDFDFNQSNCKVEFDFDEIVVLGFKIALPKGKAAEIGSTLELGSSNNVDLIENDKRPFFNWISADEQIATARGGGGGLALWKRVVEDDEVEDFE